MSLVGVLSANFLELPTSAIFGHVLPFLGALKVPVSCRGGAKLQNEYSNIKIRQELTSEMRKM